jgi:hypothetical protein
MITYPECQACECDPETTAPGSEDGTSESIPSAGLITQLSNSGLYSEYIESQFLISNPANESDAQLNGVMYAQGIAGRGSSIRNPQQFKSTQSQVFTFSMVLNFMLMVLHYLQEKELTYIIQEKNILIMLIK